jgi:hypothetical protein
VVEKLMDFPDDAPESIKMVWELTTSIAKQQGRTVRPDEFAHRFVILNFT